MNDTYWDAEHEFRSRSVGRGKLANAIREAQEQGLSLEDFESMIPHIWRNELEYARIILNDVVQPLIHTSIDFGTMKEISDI